jgi:hypothetical protein
VAVTLAQAVAAVESAGNPHAYQFVQALYDAQIASPVATSAQPIIDRIASIHSCDHDSAVAICFSSYGLFQILGENIWDPAGFAYPNDFIDYCADTDSQQDSFEEFCARFGIAYTAEELLADDAKLTAFVTRWNGPGNVPAYSAKLRAALLA